VVNFIAIKVFQKIRQQHLEELGEVGALPEAVKVVDDPL
jgi:hypothetical protein